MQWTPQNKLDLDSVSFWNANDPVGQHRVDVLFEPAGGIYAVSSLYNSDISFIIVKAWGHDIAYDIQIYAEGGTIDCVPPLTKKL